MNWKLLATGLVFLAVVLFMLWVAFLPAKASERPPSTTYIPEKYRDFTLEAPTEKLYLGDFVYNPAAPNPNPWCTPTWYAIRYVRQSDGGYSALGPWTDLPVQAGVDTQDLPCPNGVCAGHIASGEGSCRYNMPTIGNVEPLRYSHASSDPIWANVHRRTTPPRYDAAGVADADEGEIIGRLVPTNTMRLKGLWTDAPPPGKVQTAANCETAVCASAAVPPPGGPCGSVPGAPGLDNAGDAGCEVSAAWLTYTRALPLDDPGAPIVRLQGRTLASCRESCELSSECAAVQLKYDASGSTGSCSLYAQAPRAYANASAADTGGVLRAKL